MIKLYSGTTDPFSHRCRFVFCKKSMDFNIIDVDMLNMLDKHHPYLHKGHLLVSNKLDALHEQ